MPNIAPSPDGGKPVSGAGLALRQECGEKSALIKPLRSRAVEQSTLSSPLRMAGRRDSISRSDMTFARLPHPDVRQLQGKNGHGTLCMMAKSSPAFHARKPRRVKANFIGPLAVALVFIMCVFAMAIYRIEARVRDQDLAERSAAVAKLFEQKLDKDTNLMMATMRAMMTNPAIEDAFRERDRACAGAQRRRIVRSLRDEHRITHLYFTRPDLVNLYRFHSPGRVRRRDRPRDDATGQGKPERRRMAWNWGPWGR